MRKIILGVVAAAAIAAPLVAATAANAATTGSGAVDTTTYSAGGPYHHVLNVDYTCATDPIDGHTVINFVGTSSSTNDVPNSITLAGSLVPSTGGGGVFSFHAANGGYTADYAGEYAASGVWTDAGATDSNGAGLGFGGGFDTVTGAFTAIPDCVTPEVKVPGNHGEYVSGAAKAGVKGKDLAAIAKDVSLVGPYTKG